MANEIFDRETLLDLTVNVIPLFIIGFFVVTFAVTSPFGIDPLTSSIQFGLLAIPFVLLAILTYFAGQAVAGSERRGPVYLPGQAGVRGAEPLEHDDGDGSQDDEAAAAIESDGDDATSAVEGDAETATADDADATDDSEQVDGDSEQADDAAADDDAESE